ncbi:MAG: multicopper oxidase domain-containing protein [Bacteroidota bacterium]
MASFSQDLTPEIKGDSIIYRLTVDYATVVIDEGKQTEAMLVNGSLPAPLLRFKEGKIAVIHVTNNMRVSTSMHWHGLLLPNIMDGVSNLTTPPIKPGKTQTYHFPLKQSGTYWYHSHTGLQEQKGIYGSIVVDPIENTYNYDQERVLVLSDWIHQNPKSVLTNLRRHNEWYAVRIGNAPSVVESIKSKALRAQFELWKQKMPTMHISDVYYDAYMINAKKEIEYKALKPGERVRIRVINAAGSTYFWLNSGQHHMEMISADGLDINPSHHEKVLIGIGETYDFLVTVPERGSLEFRATSQDVVGQASVWLGEGERIPAKDIPFPDYQDMNKRMAAMHSGSGGHSMHDMLLVPEEKGVMSVNPDKKLQEEKMDHEGHIMEGMQAHQVEDHTDHSGMNHDEKDTEDHSDHTMHTAGSPVDPMIMWDVGYNATQIRARTSTVIQAADSIRSLTFNLTGNMWRYIWSMNGKTLSETDKIKIRKGEVVRITLNNTTMMHHPMHLHGHYFRVLNGEDEFAPLKHTIDVPPMSRITIEFEADEDKDWFFHCHLLYHMAAGMGRIVSYEGSTRDERLSNYPIEKVFNKDRQWFNWGTADIASHATRIDLVRSNNWNQVNLNVEYGWNENIELNADYERFVGDFFRVYGGINIENENKNSLEEQEIAGRLGIRYLIWFILSGDVSIDHQLRPQLELESHLPITQRLMLTSHLELESDFGITNTLADNQFADTETVWNIGLEYLLSLNWSLISSYDNRFGAGMGISRRF